MTSERVPPVYKFVITRNGFMRWYWTVLKSNTTTRGRAFERIAYGPSIGYRLARRECVRYAERDAGVYTHTEYYRAESKNDA
jgi:hypothetical protein